jgi:hypothetical protein
MEESSGTNALALFSVQFYKYLYCRCYTSEMAQDDDYE